MRPIPIGTEVEKINSEPGDGHVDGARGKVVQCLGPFDLPEEQFKGINYFYFVEWNDFPVPVGITEKKVRTVQHDNSGEGQS